MRSTPRTAVGGGAGRRGARRHRRAAGRCPRWRRHRRCRRPPRGGRGRRRGRGRGRRGAVLAGRVVRVQVSPRMPEVPSPPKSTRVPAGPTARAAPRTGRRRAGGRRGDPSVAVPGPKIVKGYRPAHRGRPRTGRCLGCHRGRPSPRPARGAGAAEGFRCPQSSPFQAHVSPSTCEPVRPPEMTTTSPTAS